MQTIKELLKVIGLVSLLLLIFAIKIFIALAIMSILVVPITYICSLILGRSYSSLIDSSGILYTLNKMGQYGIVAMTALAIFYLFFKF